MEYYKREDKWEFTYEIPMADGNVKTKVIYVKSKEKIQQNREACAKYGYRVVSVKKLYPFNTYKNQHNFDLINNVCFNEMHDMDMGEIPYDEKRYDELAERKDLAERFFCLPLPTAWLPWEEWKQATDLATAAVIHRQEACIRNGRTDLLQYCD